MATTTTKTADATVSALTKMLISGDVTVSTLMAQVADGRIESADAAAAITAYTAQVSASAPTKSLTYRVNHTCKDGTPGKRGVSICGLNGRFPLTCYAEQWLRLLESQRDLIQFISSNADSVALKASTPDAIRQRCAALLGD